jgi:hypothetical protein
MTQPPADLVAYAKSFAKGRAAALDAVPADVANTVNCWIANMMAAAEAGDSNRVHAIAGRIGYKLKDELAFQLHEQRKDRDRQRG